MNIKPLGDRVLIERKEAEQKTASGIIIPNSAQKKQPQGTVIAVGTAENMDVKKGDNVLYTERMAEEIEADGKKYIIVKQADIIAII